MRYRIIAVVLAVLTVFSTAIFPALAQITYYDDFNSGEKGDFWGDIGNFVIENGAMTGYSDAVVAQSAFTNFYNSPLYQSGVGTLKEFTVWVDVKIDRDKPDADAYGAGLWICDPSDQAAGRANDRDVYKLFYYAKEGTRTSFVRFSVDSPRNGMGSGVLGTLTLDGDPGFNISGTPVKLGLMCRPGILVAFANGKTVAAYSYSTIGTNYTPVLFWNTNCYVEFDNFCVGDLGEDVAARTALGSSSNTAHSVTVESGVTFRSSAYEGNAVTICANEAASGQTFAGWQVLSGDVELADPSAPITAFSMPNKDVRVRATYKSGSSSGTSMNPTYLTFANSTDYNALISSTYNECARAIENGELKLTAQNVGSSNSAGLPDPFVQIRYTKLTNKIYAEDYKYLTLIYRVPDTNSQSSYDTEVFFNTQNRGARAGQSVMGNTAAAGGKYRYLTLNASALSEWEGLITSIRLDFFNRAANGDVMYVHNILFSKTASDARLQANAVTQVLNTPNETTLSFNMNSHGSQIPDQTLLRGQLPTRPADPVADGYVFDNWYTTRSCTALFDFGSPLSEDTMIYAKWYKLYNVTFECGSGVSAPETQIVRSGDCAVRPADPEREGYTFGGWYTTSACTQEFDFAVGIRGNRTIYAKWDKVFDPSESTVVVKAPSVEVMAGVGEVEVPITITGCPEGGLSSMLFTTRVVGAQITSGAPGAALPDGSNAVVGPTASSAKNGVAFMWLSFTDAITEDTDVVTFTVALPDGAAVGDSFEIVVTPSENAEDFLSDDGETAYGASGENGSITIVANTRVAECVAAIDAIGTVTLDSGAAIAAAEAKYAALNADEKAAVTNYAALTAARTEYDALVAEKEASDARVADCVAAIDAIGTVTLDSGAAIAAAEAKYAALNADEKAAVTNYAALTAARAAYDALAADPDAARIVVSDVTASAGDRIEVSVSIVNNPGIAAILLALSYDTDALTLEGFENGGMFSAFTVGDSRVRYLFDEGENVTDDGVLITFTFTVREGTPDGGYHIGMTVKEASDYDLEDVAIASAIGTVTVVSASGVLYGDANGDGEISTKDIVLIRRYLANYDEETGISAVEIEAGADSNGDGEVSSKDIVLLRRYLANYDEETGTSTVELGPQS